MLTKKQLEILEVFRKNLGKKLTFKEIKQKAKINSNNLLQKTIKTLKEEEIITSETIGKSILYKLKLNTKTFSYFSLIPHQLYKLPLKTLQTIINEISKSNKFFSLVIFGSYAKKENKKNSDLDIAIIANNAKSLKPIINSLKRKELIRLDPHLITIQELEFMLDYEKETLGKEILRNHIAFYNIETFYKIIEKWIH